MLSKEEYLALAAEEYDKINELNTDYSDSFYDYEKTFDGIWRGLGREVLKQNISSTSSDRRTKKKANLLWQDRDFQ